MSDIIIVGPGGNSGVDLPPQPTAGQYYLMTKEAADSAAESAKEASNAAAYELQTWGDDETFDEFALLTEDANGNVLTANIKWPDGTLGVFTTDLVDPIWNGINSWHATYLGATTKTVTQPTVTRRATDGRVIFKPRVVIS